MSVAVVISASSMEAPFLRPLIAQCLHFSDNVVVAHGTHLFTGEPEDAAVFAALRKRFRGSPVRFVQYPVQVPVTDSIAMHNASRVEGVKVALLAAAAAAPAPADAPEDGVVVSSERKLRSRTVPPVRTTGTGRAVSAAPARPWLLFLDADEVPDGRAVAAWWQASAPSLDEDTAYKLANHWYFLMPTMRASAAEDSVLLVHSKHVAEHPETLRHPRERDGIILANPVLRDRVARSVRGPDGQAMFHHFSWVRSREHLLRKVTSWGHRGDRPWRDLLQHTWRMIDELRMLPARDFVHGYKLEHLPEAPDVLVLTCDEDVDDAMNVFLRTN